MITSERLDNFKEIVYKLLDITKDDEVSVIEEAEEKVKLPDDYIERFTIYSLQNKNALKGREKGLLSLERAYDNWKIVNAPLLLITYPGEGATSLLHASTYIYPKARIIESHESIDSYAKLIDHLKKVFNLQQEFENLKALEEHLIEQNEDYVVILENIERLFIRKIKGFNLLEDFLLFLHATKKFVYWIISVNKYSFYYLNRVKYFASHFPYIIKLNPVDNDELKTIISERNRGYTIVYLKPTRLAKKTEKQFKTISSEEKQKILEEMYFRKLFDYARGNISKAILFAKYSAQNVKDKTVYIKPFVSRPIKDLNLNDLFVLEAIFQHRALTISELNVVLRNSNRESRLTIEKLLEKDLIRTTENDKGDIEYRINLMYIGELKNMLRERLNRNFK